MTKILSYLLLPNKRCSQRNSSPHHSQLSKNMKSYFCQFLAICSELSSLRHNLIHGVPKLTPRDSLHSLQNIKSYFACLLVICSELSRLRHNLIHGVPKLTPRDSLHSLQNIKSYFACLLAIYSELSRLRHNLILQRLDYRPAHLLLFLHHQHEQVLFHIFQLTLNPELLTQDSTLYLQHSDLHYSLFHHVKMF